MTTYTLVMATHNKGKLREFKHALRHVPITLHTQDEYGIREVDEPCRTFVENAIRKARYVCRQTGQPAVADDSGLRVDALWGRPGVKSARFAGTHGDDEANIAKLLKEMEDVEDSRRSARFHCVTVYLRHADDPGPLICQGIWEGYITRGGRGDAGFGYDPVFYVPQYQCTAAELTLTDKNKVSHRGQALRCLVKHLKQQSGMVHES